MAFTDKVTAKDFAKMDPEYKDLLVRVLTIQADCEIGGPNIYVPEGWVGHRAPTPEDLWKMGKTATEEVDHFRKMNRLLNDIGHDATWVVWRPREERYVEAFRSSMPTWADGAVKLVELCRSAEARRRPRSPSTAGIRWPSTPSARASRSAASATSTGVS